MTARNVVLRAPLLADGAAGPLEAAHERLRADDFAFSDTGSLYVATHPAHSVLRVSASGDRATLAGPEEGAVGSTACAFGRGKGTEASALYVTTSGGLFAPWRGKAEEAKLLRLEVGEKGLDPLDYEMWQAPVVAPLLLGGESGA